MLDNIQSLQGVCGVTLKIISLLDKETKLAGMVELKKASDENIYRCRVIVGGGDGTVMWVVEEMEKVGINFAKVSVGVIPFGTGNDFARVLGWGGAAPSGLSDPTYKKLKSLMKDWVTASKEPFDLW